MTDNEIIKALECCIKSANAGECLTLKCPLLGDYGCAISGDEEKLYEYALELINRQKAEIERLQAENKILSANADTAFQDGLNENRELFKKEVEAEIKSEAYKEFAERLKFIMYPNVKLEYADIENLLKELTEKNDKE